MASILSKLKTAAQKVASTVKTAGQTLKTNIQTAPAMLKQLQTAAATNLLRMTGPKAKAPVVQPITKAQQLASHAAVAAKKKLAVTVGGGGSTANQAALKAQADTALRKQIIDTIVALENQWANIPIALTDAEKDIMLQRAIAQATPYYDNQKSLIYNSIETGKIRSAEDVLLATRDTKQEAEDLLKSYDLAQARTEEEFVNQMVDITATEGENLETLRYNWRERIRDAQQGQIERNVLTSGIGMKEVRELRERQATEETTLGRRAGQARTETITARTYDLAKIQGAREEVERERIRRIGTPEQEATTTGAALGRAGLPGLEALPSYAQIAYQRGEAPYRQYLPEDIAEMEEQEKRAIESRKLVLQQEEFDIRKIYEESLRKKIEAEEARLRRYNYA